MGTAERADRLCGGNHRAFSGAQGNQVWPVTRPYAMPTGRPGALPARAPGGKGTGPWCGLLGAFWFTPPGASVSSTSALSVPHAGGPPLGRL